MLVNKLFNTGGNSLHYFTYHHTNPFTGSWAAKCFNLLLYSAINLSLDSIFFTIAYKLCTANFHLSFECMAKDGLVKKVYGSMAEGARKGRLQKRYIDAMSEIFRVKGISEEDTWGRIFLFYTIKLFWVWRWCVWKC